MPLVQARTGVRDAGGAGEHRSRPNLALRIRTVYSCQVVRDPSDGADATIWRTFSENETSGQFPTIIFFPFSESVYVTFYFIFGQNRNCLSFSFKAFDSFFTFFC